jgi:hypothetical protein
VAESASDHDQPHALTGHLDQLRHAQALVRAQMVLLAAEGCATTRSSPPA